MSTSAKKSLSQHLDDPAELARLSEVFLTRAEKPGIGEVDNLKRIAVALEVLVGLQLHEAALRTTERLSAQANLLPKAGKPPRAPQ